MGWLISDPERIRNLASLKRTFDLGTPILTQAVAYNLFKSGEYDRHAAGSGRCIRSDETRS